SSYGQVTGTCVCVYEKPGLEPIRPVNEGFLSNWATLTACKDPREGQPAICDELNYPGMSGTPAMEIERWNSMCEEGIRIQQVEGFDLPLPPIIFEAFCAPSTNDPELRRLPIAENFVEYKGDPRLNFDFLTPLPSENILLEE